MLEIDSRGLPFKAGGKIIEETRHRLIVGLEPSSVIKVSKEMSDRDVFDSVDDALAEILQNDNARNKIANLLALIGASRQMITPTQTVIHSTPSNEGITYTEFQGWYKYSLPLAKMRSSLFSLPIQTIRDLKSLFQVNNYLLRTEKTCFEFDGSSGPTPPKTREKILHNLFPLLFAHNVLIDPNGKPELVDVESLEKFSRFTRIGIKGWARRQIKRVGFQISTGILDSILFINRISNLGYRHS